MSGKLKTAFVFALSGLIIGALIAFLLASVVIGAMVGIGLALFAGLLGYWRSKDSAPSAVEDKSRQKN